jgi:NAD(P)-dependent dehydrogenase (short-subunit alcohol dehydrogenase family)
MTDAPDGGGRRSVLVTGCSTGIGRCAAQVLKAHGYRVLATARKADDLAALADEGYEAVPLDLGDGDSVAAAAEAALAATDGRLFGLFNNAAYALPGAIEDLPRAAFSEQIGVNLVGTVDLTARLLPAMRQAGAGRIVMNSSVLGYVALPYRGAYVASKYALEGIADTLRLELAGSGVYVSLIEPGSIHSAFRANARAAHARHVDASASAHRGAYDRMAARQEAEGREPPFSRPPEAVVRCLLHALEARRPRARYRVTLPARLLYALKRVLPDRALDGLLTRFG